MKNFLIVADGHYYKDEKGSVYVDSVYDYNFFKRYIDVIGEIIVACRIEYISSSESYKYKKCSGPNITFYEMTPFKGPLEYLKKYFKVRREAKEIAKSSNKAIFRIPSATSNILLKQYRKINKPYAVEVVVDPWEFFSPGTTKSVFRPFIRISWTLFTKNACRKASASSYVTRDYLQKRYPASPNSIQSYYSSVEITSESIKKPRTYSKTNAICISHVCNGFATMGKGHIPLMESISILKQRGINVFCKFVGDGPLRHFFEQYAEKLNIKENVYFVGKLPSGDEVRKVITNSDLFVFPTKAEGLPRVLLEAMAEGLPCISTPVCGIPEILKSDFLVKYDDYIGLADKIEWLYNNPKIMTNASECNIETVNEYTKDKLQERRSAFYRRFLEL